MQTHIVEEQIKTIGDLAEVYRAWSDFAKTMQVGIMPSVRSKMNRIANNETYLKNRLWLVDGSHFYAGWECGKKGKLIALDKVTLEHQLEHLLWR